MATSLKKIRTLTELAAVVSGLKKEGKCIVHCHGVFDLIHIGHIKHLQAAKEMGDILIVTLTPDKFVNKGPHRPAFPIKLRADAIASLGCVDFVAFNEWPTAVETIRLLQPDLYIKGVVAEQGKRDHTDAIILEEETVKAVGGRLVLTDEDIYSASYLINRYMDIFSPEAKNLLMNFRSKYTPEDIIGYLRSVRSVKVLVVGDTIVDEYQFCRTMGKATKDPILGVEHLYTEKYAGSVLAIANHLSNFCDNIGLLSILGEIDPQKDFILSKLNSNICAEFISRQNAPTIIKRRFLESYKAVKLFEVYIMPNENLTPEEETAACKKLEEMIPHYDVVIVADYGHGMMTPILIDLVCKKAVFLAVNVQANTSNRSLNLISKYPRADFISTNEYELRLEAHDMEKNVQDIIKDVTRKHSCKKLLMTMGEKGCLYFDSDFGFFETPAFSVKTVDLVGAGDAVFSLVAPCIARGVPADMIGFIANVIGAEACAIMGNKSSIKPTTLFRHITSLMK